MVYFNHKKGDLKMPIFKIILKFRTANDLLWVTDAMWYPGSNEHDAIRRALDGRQPEDPDYRELIGAEVVDRDFVYRVKEYLNVYRF